jgi:hypothetical protein
MKKISGFALLEVLLAVILIAIITVGSYSLVKSFRATSSMQKLTRYSTTITENYMPFLDGSVSTDVMSSDHKLSESFLKSINIPSSDLASCSGGYCYVDSGLVNDSGTEIDMKFATIETSDNANFFKIAFTQDFTPEQKDQAMQSLGSMFSLYCPTDACVLSDDTDDSTVAVKLIFPKAGDDIPNED